MAGDVATIAFVGVPADTSAGVPNSDTIASLQPLVENAALTMAINEAWAMIAALSVVALLCVAFARRARRLVD